MWEMIKCKVCKVVKDMVCELLVVHVVWLVCLRVLYVLGVIYYDEFCVVFLYEEMLDQLWVIKEVMGDLDCG